MGLIRLLLVILLIWVAWRLLRGVITGSGNSPQNSNPGSNPTRMVKCSQCGVHLPEQEAIQRDEHFFCGRPHLEAWQDAHQDD